MQGPFDYRCLLTISGCREGYTSPGMFPFFIVITSCFYLIPESRYLWHFKPCHSQKEFGGSGATASSEWYDVKLQNCTDFDKTSMSFCYQLIVIILIVWLFFSSYLQCFRFTLDDFVGMPSLPLYKRLGKIADLPIDSLVSFFFAMSSYAKRIPGSSSTPASGTSSNDVLSLIIHHIIYYGIIPHDV